MLIQYYLADGQEVIYHTADNLVTMSDIDNLAVLYAQKRQNVLPQYVFVSVRISRDLLSGTGMYMGMYQGPGPNLMYITTSAGPLEVKIMPWASDTKLLLVGRMDDYERYDIDRIFEETVLKDCEAAE